MTLWLALSECKDPNLKEEVIWHISQKLRIPAILVQLHKPEENLGPGQQFQTSNLRVEVSRVPLPCWGVFMSSLPL